MENSATVQTTQMGSTEPKRSKTKYIVLTVVLLIIAALAVAGVVAYRMLFSAPIRTAEVEPRNLGVEVYVNGTLVDGVTAVKEGDTVETKMGGNASLQMFESSVVLLDMNTKVVIESLKEDAIRLRLESGRTWHEVSGVHTNGSYVVTDGTFTATVKGTAFEMHPGGKIMTGEGVVAVTKGDEIVEVNQGEVSEVTNGKLVKRVATAQEKGNLAGGLQQSVSELRELRNEEIAKYPEVLELVKEKFNTDEATIRQTLLDADIGKYNVDAELEKFPIKVPVINRVAAFTKEIQELETTRAGHLK